jgi:glycosyltransferase involved in cell wall biosynthesis
VRSEVAAPAVSIIVPAFVATRSQQALLDETLATVAAQTCDSYELIVVDDGSPLEVARITAGHPKARTIRQSNSGPAIARNTGIAASSGQHFIFLDADDHLLPPALEAGLHALATHPECGFAVGPREEMTFEGQPVPWSIPVPPQQTRIYQSLLAFDWYIIPPSSVMFRREAVAAIGRFQDPWGADDLDYYLRAAQKYDAWCYPSPAVTRYRRYSASSSRDGERMLHSIRAVYARQWPLVHEDPDAEAAFHRGLQQLTEIFRDALVENIQDRIRSGDDARARHSARVLARESPARLQALQASDERVASLLEQLDDSSREGALSSRSAER